MENYKIELKQYIDDDVDEFIIEIKLNEPNITVATILLPNINTIKENEQLIELRDNLYNDVKMFIVLYECNGGIIIEKNDQYLTFVISKYGDDIYGEMKFTIKINDSVLDMLNKIINL